MPSIDQHPSPERLVAFHERQLAEDEAEDVQAHLMACADCTAQLLELADLLDEDGDGAARSEISRSELDAAWQRQRERLPQVAPVVSLEERRAGRTLRRWSWMTAASLGLAAALALVVVAQWRTIDLLKQPRVNPPLVNLEPAGSVRAGSPEVSELRFPEGEEWAWVILNPALEPDSSLYDIKIVAADGEVALSFQDRPISEDGNFRLEIPRASLEEGSYRILLFKAGQDRIIGKFGLKVRYLLG